MGKKSKRKSNNKPPLCYHGCTKKEFNNCGEFFKVFERWDNNKGTTSEFIQKNLLKFEIMQPQEYAKAKQNYSAQPMAKKVVLDL